MTARGSTPPHAAAAHAPRARRRAPFRIVLAVAGSVAAVSFAAAPARVTATPEAPLAACGSNGWHVVDLPKDTAAQSLAVDVAEGRQRLYAAVYRPAGGATFGESALWAIDLNQFSFRPFAAFDAANSSVRGIAVRPDSGLFAAGLSTGGVRHSTPAGATGALELERRLVPAVEAGDGMTFAAATDLATDAAAGLESGAAAVWRRTGDEPFVPLANGDTPFGSGYFWDLALDRTGRLWTSMDGNGVFSFNGATALKPGATGWQKVQNFELGGQTAKSLAVDPAAERYVYAGIGRSVTKPNTSVEGHFGLRRSADGGASWTEYPYDGTTGDRLGGGTPFRDFEVPSLAVGPAGGLVWASVWGQALYVSKDHGAQWHRLRLPNGATPYFDALATARVSATCDLVFASGKDGLWARAVADVMAEIARTIYLPAIRGAPWELNWPSAATRPAPHGG